MAINKNKTEAAKASTVAGTKPSRIEREDRSQFPLGRNNFIFMGVAVALIVIGFLLMLGGSSTTEAFNPDIFSTRRIVVGPTIAFIGFIAMGIAIIIKPGERKSATDEEKKA
ncbi:MAG: DUF3098 domain-containing protein [Muribaculaceae bacterium]|nr:DUF3098 domain-containing protein [Muribaculaceae bacterium]